MTAAPILLDDAAMRRFLIEGYLVLKPEFPDRFHEGIYQQLEAVLGAGGNPRNNLLPRVPALQQVIDHPVVHGALSSILGADYYLHLHRHVHDNHPGSKGQNLHKDSLYNSRYAVDDKRRHHHTRWLMLFYYPQDTPVELGPTAILPRSQYLNVQRPADQEEVALHGEAGTVTIVHYDLLHRGMPNTADRTRFMCKFLFTRMSEPTAPTWDHEGAEWQPVDDPQGPIWQQMWAWHRGAANTGTPSSRGSVAALTAALGDEAEIVGMRAAYELGAHGEAAIPALVEALREEAAAVPRNAAYAFNRIGAAAVPALLAAARDEDSCVRARALDILGDMGLAASDAVPGLVASLEDAEEDARRRAAEALGIAGQRTDGLSGPLAERLRQDASAEVRRNAALSLARLGPRAAGAEPALARAMTDENHYVRGFSVHALARIGTPEASQALVRHLQTMRWDWA